MTQSTTSKSDVVSPRKEIQRNVHACDISQTHVNVWDYLDDSADTQAWLKRIGPGDLISVVPRATFLAWENHVKHVQIEVFCAWQ